MYHPCTLLLTSLTSTHIALIVAICFLLCCSAFFSCSETAFNSMNAIRMRTMAENKVKGAGKALYIYEHSARMITTILVGNNIVNILATTLCALILSDLITNSTLYTVLNTVVMTIIILIFGEILPKAFARSAPEKFAVKLSTPVYYVMKLFYPIVIPFYSLQRIFTKKQEQENESVTVTEDELESIIDTMEEEGVLQKEDADLLQGTMKIKDATAHDVMTHRVDVVFLSVDATTDEVENTFMEYQYSRLPVYRNNTDDVVGVLHIKDFFTAKVKGEDLSLESLMTPPLFTAENTNIDTLIRDMQKEKKHLAIVIDENGGVSGIVTMEDAIETIVGEIYDETDTEEKEPEFVQVGDDSYEFDAEVTVEDLFDRLQIEKVPENQYRSMGAFLFELSEDVPEKGKKYEFDTVDEILDDEGNMTAHKINMAFTILVMEGHRIKKIGLKINYLDKLDE